MVSDKAEITFDDILLLPNKSDYRMSEEVNKTNLSTKISKNLEIKIPIVSSPMPGVTEDEMAITLGKMGSLGFIHYFQGFERQLAQVSNVKKQKVKVAATVGDLTNKGLNHIEHLLKANVDLISIDTPHAHNKQVLQFIEKVKKTFPKIELNAAVVVTQEGTKELIKLGVDSIRVGIGPGSHCTTRLVTGVGRPQLSTIKRCYDVAKKENVPLIAEGGIKVAGDIPKALAFGASAVMIGGMFAGTDECPGKIVKKKGKLYKYSWGMCTDPALKHQTPKLLSTPGLFSRISSIFRLKKDTSDKLFEEGVEGLIPYKGSVKPVVENLVSGIRRSMWYQGARNLKQLKEKARYVLVSPQTMAENTPRI